MLQQLARLTPGSHRQLVPDGPAGAMEILVDVPSAVGGIALIGHPQPVLGGSAMHKIPSFLARGLHAAGWLTLRPNFRGVGGSAGVHDEARGEAQDMVWLASQLRLFHPGRPLALVGFSFGAYVMGRAAQRLADAKAPADAVVLAGAPVGTVETGRHYEAFQLAPNTLVIHGERDAEVLLQPVLDWCGGLVVAHASLGGAFVLNARGEVTHYVRSPAGVIVTNVAFEPGTSRLVMTESQSGTILEAELPAPGVSLFGGKSPG